MIYVLHHAAALLLAIAAAAYLRRAGWVPGRPHLAVGLWQITGLTGVSALVGGLIALGLAPLRQGVVPGLGSFFAGHLDAGRSALVVTGLGLAAAVLAAQAVFTVRVARHRARHRDLLTLVARRRGEALELEHGVAVAYCLPGRTPRIVVSSGARSLLTEAELQAVLAHERAHLRGRHHLVLGPFSALAAAVPWFRRTAEDLALLVEMCADDHAARRHGAGTVASALRKFHQLGTGAPPAGALAAAAGALGSRIARLSRPRPAPRRLRVTLALAVAVTVLATPLSLYLTPL